MNRTVGCWLEEIVGSEGSNLDAGFNKPVFKAAKARVAGAEVADAGLDSSKLVGLDRISGAAFFADCDSGESGFEAAEFVDAGESRPDDVVVGPDSSNFCESDGNLREIEAAFLADSDGLGSDVKATGFTSAAEFVYSSGFDIILAGLAVVRASLASLPNDE